MTELDEWPDQAKADTNLMLDLVGPFAQSMIRRDGIILPCGAGVTVDGALEPFAVDPGMEFPEMNDAFSFLVSSVIQERDRYRAVCLVVAVTLPDGRDALRFLVERRSRGCAALLMEFRRVGLRQVVFDDLAPVPVEPVVWGLDQGPRRVVFFAVPWHGRQAG